MTMSASEIESLRFHLNYGNISVLGSPYTPDGFQEVFSQVIAPNLDTDTETTATLPASVLAGETATLTVASNTNFLPYTILVVDVGDDTELVEAKAVGTLTFTAKFALAHTTPMPVAILSGTMRLRLMLRAANTSWRTEHGPDITGTAGIKSLGKGEIEYFPGGAALADVSGQYATIQARISALVRVPLCDNGMGKKASANLEAY